MEAFKHTASRLADAAAAVVRPHFRQAVAIDNKADESPVTLADRDAEAAMREILTATFPEHGIIGEEHGSEREDAEYVWILDPIDGTRSFITGSPLFGTLIALTRSGKPFLGIIDMPMLGERWLGLVGEGATFTDSEGTQAVSCRPCASLAEAYLRTTAPEQFEATGDTPAWNRIRKAVKQPIYGGDCYSYGLLASGFVDLVVETGLQTYDYMALVPVVESAGGHVSDWSGKPLGAGSDGRIVMAGDPRIQQAALALIASS